MQVQALDKLSGGLIRLRLVQGDVEKVVTMVPLTTGDIVDFEEAMGPLIEFGTEFPRYVAKVAYAFWLTLRSRQPDLSLAEAGQLVDFADMNKVGEAMQDYFPGPKPSVSSEPGDEPETPPTGPSSSPSSPTAADGHPLKPEV